MNGAPNGPRIGPCGCRRARSRSRRRHRKLYNMLSDKVQVHAFQNHFWCPRAGRFVIPLDELWEWATDIPVAVNNDHHLIRSGQVRKSDFKKLDLTRVEFLGSLPDDPTVGPVLEDSGAEDKLELEDDEPNTCVDASTLQGPIL